MAAAMEEGWIILFEMSKWCWRGAWRLSSSQVPEFDSQHLCYSKLQAIRNLWTLQVSALMSIYPPLTHMHRIKNKNGFSFKRGKYLSGYLSIENTLSTLVTREVHINVRTGSNPSLLLGNSLLPLTTVFWLCYRTLNVILLTQLHL